MVRRAFLFFLILSTLLANFSRLVISVGFDLNHKYIADHLCENRNRPWLHCDGKCYFMKKIRQAEENDRRQGTKERLDQLEIVFFQSANDFRFENPASLIPIQIAFTDYRYWYSNPCVKGIFKPPRHLSFLS
jgi:hypothetical protein